MRPTSAQIDLGAIAHNVTWLAQLAAPAQLCVVVKADGYGHGALPVARTAVAAGAPWLAVALVEEGIELRRGGIEAPILLLSEPRPQEMVEVIEHQLCPTVYSPQGVAALTAAMAGSERPWPVHLKVDTGMHRVGATPQDALKLAQTLAAKPEIELQGVWTHCATADDIDNPYADSQLSRFNEFLAALEQTGINPQLAHAANSAVLLTRPHGHFDLVRVGLAVYGVLPAGLDTVEQPAMESPDKEPAKSTAAQAAAQLRPAMQLRSKVSFSKQVAAGAGISYGQLHHFDAPATVATVPIGYADGIRRDFGLRGGQVLLDGQRCPVVGAVTMDQLMVEVSAANQPADPSTSSQPGAEVVLIGQQAQAEITVSDVAQWLDTIPYEIVCDIGKRVRREYV